MDYVEGGKIFVRLYSELIMCKPCKDIAVVKTNYPYVDIEFLDGRIATIDIPIKDIINHCDDMVKVSRGCFIKGSFIKRIDVSSKKKNEKSAPRKYANITTATGYKYESSSIAFYDDVYKFILKKGMCKSKKSLKDGMVISILE